ncbi:MAG TPA: methyltransferase domain-containing protein [Candidatus Limnocylindrales bacterium]|jgi:ubiquinone/menaquinone biosynthesis C-methylase UbiE
MTLAQPPEPSTRTSGLVIRTPRRYDLRLWLGSRGREGRFRDEEIRLARIRPGERVLDLGCGTGSLAIAAARAVGRAGTVTAIDPSNEMLARARSKARRARVDATFVATAGEALPFPDAGFDVVLISLVLHQLPSDALHGTMVQVRRVLRPGGRLFVVDLGTPEAGKRTVHSHGTPASGGARFTLDGLEMFFDHLGLRVVERGDIEFRFRNLEPLRYVLAEA